MWSWVYFYIYFYIFKKPKSSPSNTCFEIWLLCILFIWVRKFKSFVPNYSMMDNDSVHSNKSMLVILFYHLIWNILRRQWGWKTISFFSNLEYIVHVPEPCNKELSTHTLKVWIFVHGINFVLFKALFDNLPNLIDAVLCGKRFPYLEKEYL